MSSSPPDEAGSAPSAGTLAAAGSVHGIATGVASTAPVSEERFDRIVRLARQVMGADVALLAIGGPGRAAIHAAVGLDLPAPAPPSPLLDEAFRTRELVVVEDAGADERFRADPLLAGPPPLRFFAGHSLVEPAGNRVAVLAVLGRQPRSVAPDAAGLLADVVALAERELGRSALDALLVEYRQGSAWAQAVMDNVTEALVTIGSDGCVLSVNRSAQRMFGRSDLVGRHVGDILAPEDREVLERSVRLALGRAGDAMRVTHECSAMTAAGERFPVEISLGGTWLTGDETVLVAVVHDLSNVRREEAMVRQLSRLLEEAHDAIIIQQPPTGTISFWNMGAEATYGYTKEEAIGRSSHELLQTRFPIPLEEIYERVRTEGRWQGELRHRHRDGREVVVATRQAALRKDEGAGTAIVEINRDISERIAAESALLLSELRHTATFDQSPMGICLVSPTGVMLDVNPALAAFLERPADRLVGTSVRDITHPEDVAPTDANYKQIADGLIERFSMEKRYLTPGGEVKWGNLTAAGAFTPDGALDYFVAMVEDINDRKRAEGQLVEALENQQRAIEDLDRLSKAKSYFVSLVGHEFRTALTGIQGFSELLAEQDFEPHEVKEFASEIHREGLRLTRMISEMLDLDRMESGRMKLNVGPVDLNQVVQDVVERFRATTEEHEIVTDLGTGLEGLEADGDKLTQVLSNLVANAIKYSPRGGRVTIRTARQDGEALVQVQDEGLGVPVEALETIFERYARHESKDRELIKGTGLGLPVVRQIVEMHGGKVWAANNDPERGATFTFRIPCTRPGGA